MRSEKNIDKYTIYRLDGVDDTVYNIDTLAVKFQLIKIEALFKSIIKKHCS